MLLLIRGAQFLLTQVSVVLGEGHRPVNWPTRARSAKERATWIGVSGGREISGMFSGILTNLAASLFFFCGKPAKSWEKASADEGGPAWGELGTSLRASPAYKSLPAADERSQLQELKKECRKGGQRAQSHGLQSSKGAEAQLGLWQCSRAQRSFLLFVCFRYVHQSLYSV